MNVRKPTKCDSGYGESPPTQTDCWRTTHTVEESPPTHSDCRDTTPTVGESPPTQTDCRETPPTETSLHAHNEYNEINKTPSLLPRRSLKSSKNWVDSDLDTKELLHNAAKLDRQDICTNSSHHINFTHSNA